MDEGAGEGATEGGGQGADERGARAQAPAFDAAGLARRLLRATRTGALGTLDRETGAPLCTLVTVATAHDGSPLALASTLSHHTRNLEADPRASLLLSPGGKGDPLAHPRLTLTGEMARIPDREAAARAKARFVARHPKARLYADFADFSIFTMRVTGVHLNGGFARAASLAPGDVMSEVADASALIEAEEGAVAHMNEDHRDALALYATRLARAPQADWRATGLDPDGIDLSAGDRTARVPFPERVTGPGALRRILVEMAKRARAMDEATEEEAQEGPRDGPG